jgi:competence/damage-inducible protein cinA C-terminal domain
VEMDTVTRNKTIKLIGINEAEIRTSISDLIDNEDVKIEIKPFDAKTYIILSADADTEEAAKDLIKPVSKEIKRRFGKYIYSTKEKITLEMSVVNLLEKNELTISTAESCTGGLLAGRLINVPGVSDVYKEGFITYTNKAKRKTLGVNKSTLKKYGAVSEQTAKEMAVGAALAADTDISISVTGIAGPDGGTNEKPVGLVYIGVCIRDMVHVEEFRFSGDRANVREQTVISALGLLRKCILEHFS